MDLGFLVPNYGITDEIANLIIAAFNNEKVKAELSKRIRVELDTQRNKYNGSVQSYESLTSGSVNMQTRMAASGYDVYGRTILSGNNNATNSNVHKKMKNRIKYGRAPQNGYQNRGNYNIE